MKMKSLFIYGFLFILCFGSCTKDDNKENVISNTVSVSEIKQISVIADEFGAMTRSELYREEDEINFRWSAGDTLGIFPDEGSQAFFAIDDGQEGSLSAAFDGGGWGLKASHTYSAYFPFKKETNLDKANILLDYTCQVQTGNNSYAHLGKYDYMASGAVTPTDGDLKFTMHHQGAILLLKIKVDEPNEFTECVLRADDYIFTTVASLDITGEQPALESRLKSNKITLSLNDVKTTEKDEEITLSMMVYPIDLTDKIFNVYLYTKEGKAYLFGIINKKNIEQGKTFQIQTDVINDSPEAFIIFVDQGTKEYCVNHFDANSDGEISYYEASIVTKIVKDDSISKIGSFDEFKFFNGIKNFGNTFQGCQNIKTISIPNSVTKIEGHAFDSCSSLTSVEIPNSVTSILYKAFFDCPNLQSVEIPNTSIYIVPDDGYNPQPYYVVRYDSGINNLTTETKEVIKGVILEEPMTFIPNKFLRGYSSMESVTIPNSVLIIGEEAFYGCSRLTNVEIPNSVTTIERHAFWQCSSLMSVKIPNSVTTIGNNAFAGCKSLTSVEIPNSVTTIGNNAFGSCKSLTSVEIPNSVTVLESNVFSNCSNLSSVVIPNSVITIGDQAFQDCSSLSNVVIPNSVMTIGNQAFQGCSSLSSLIIPNSVTNIVEGAFNGCSSLQKISLLGDHVNFTGNPFVNCSSLQYVEVPKESLTWYIENYMNFGVMFVAGNY